MKRVLLTSAFALSAGLFCAATARAADDGFYNVNYNNIGFELTQIGEHGELIIKPSGYGDFAYGSCTVNFTRDEAGKVKEMAPVVQSASAKCPESVSFEISPGQKGLYDIKFSEGGALKGESFELFPVLVPMTDAMRTTAPQGFDILGATLGQTREEIEALLTSKGYAKMENFEERAEYQGGYSKGSSLWGKGSYHISKDEPADLIAVTYTSIFAGESAPERAEYLGRQWRLGEADNLSVAAVKKSLEDKHGKTTSGFEERIYDRSGALHPKAFQPVCDETLHLQEVESSYNFIGEGGVLTLAPACGSQVKVMVGEDSSAPGRASYMRVSLHKGDVGYEAFWNTWSRAEAEALKKRYELQANMGNSGPEL